ncbi:MAG: hypothetical protein IPJ80_10350 [Saprospiraceae bacterium]|nr:hypothetical protein [Saprospiraceae bacterium]
MEYAHLLTVPLHRWFAICDTLQFSLIVGSNGCEGVYYIDLFIIKMKFS